MKLLSIFSNGSQAWVLLVMLIIWVAAWGYRAYKSHTGGYHLRQPDGTFIDVPRPKNELLRNTDMRMLILGAIGLIFFLFWVNSEYRRYDPAKAQEKWEKQKANENK